MPPPSVMPSATTRLRWVSTQLASVRPPALNRPSAAFKPIWPTGSTATWDGWRPRRNVVPTPRRYGTAPALPLFWA